MQKFSRNLITEWRKLGLPFSGKNILIAVSGGADSCALAYAIQDLTKREKLKHNFIIIHYNHKLRGEKSDTDAQFVKEFAEKLDLEFIYGSSKCREINNNSNIEESARIARYKFFNRVAEQANSFAVLTAHTMNDQAETLLLNLIRGSGMKGLSAMNPIRQLDYENGSLLIRPLLNWASRDEIEKFIKKNKINFRKDSMNDDINFKRVEIRKELLPLLNKYNQNIVKTLSNTTKIISNELNVLDDLLLENVEMQELIKSDELSVCKLQTLDYAMLYKIISEWLKKKRGDLRQIESVHIKAIGDLVHSKKSGRLVELPNFQNIKKTRGRLIFQDAQVEK